jgi:excisionase family DNA binding protein
MEHSVELLSTEEFAARMKVSRSTVFEWIKTGRLEAGRHFLRVGRTIRFPWGPELLQMLLADSMTARPPAPARTSPRPAARARPRAGPAVDLDY